MPNSDPWGPPGTPFITIFVFYVNPQIFNIEHFEANEVYKSREVSHFFLIKFPLECRRNHVWGPIFDPSYDHIQKTYIFVKVREGRKEGMKGGSKEGRKGGREEGRKGGRDEAPALLGTRRYQTI